MDNRARKKNLEPSILVVFGGSGDLTSRKLMPAVFKLFCDKLVTDEATVIAFARSKKTNQEYRDQLKKSVIESFDARGLHFDEKLWEEFANTVTYLSGNYDDLHSFIKLRAQIEQIAKKNNMPGNCVFYLATPPGAFVPIAQNLHASGLSRKGRKKAPWSRIVIEKPFGNSLESARELNSLLSECFDENQIFRIDHYLGKETVQNIMVMRFANTIFEDLWSHDHIDHVQITVAESLGVGKRGKYYDQAGALRDMVQNHMMHLLSLIAMEPPVSLTADAIRNEKVKVLKSLRPIPEDCAQNGVVRAQYTAGFAGGEEVPGYRESENVRPNSGTETFVAFKAYIDNWRWAGVPFYLRTGKCLPKRRTEISVHFKKVPSVLFNVEPGNPLGQNVLQIRVQPNEGISLEFQAKAPGPDMNIRPLRMEFDYNKSFGATPPDAYERLLLDAGLGDATLFTRADEVETAWEFVKPVLEKCPRDCCQLISEYRAGTWGPVEADELIAADGKQWHMR